MTEAGKPLDAPVKVPISAAEQMLRDRWKGDLSAIPLGKVVEFMQSYALAAHAEAAPRAQDLESTATRRAILWALTSVIDSSRSSEFSETCRACGGYTIWDSGVCYGIKHKEDCWVPQLRAERETPARGHSEPAPGLREAAFDECCKLMCVNCAENIPIEKTNWHTENRYCYAWAIRAALTAPVPKP